MQTNPIERPFTDRVPYPLCMAPGDDAEHGRRSSRPFDRAEPESEDLPYRVELWDQAKRAVEQVLAVTVNGSIGYAAYYAAAREFPDRYLPLRHKNRTVATLNGP